MKHVGLLIDKCKLSTYDKVLNEGKYNYKIDKTKSDRIIKLIIEVEDNELTKIVDIFFVAANRYARQTNKNLN